MFNKTRFQKKLKSGSTKLLVFFILNLLNNAVCCVGEEIVSSPSLVEVRPKESSVLALRESLGEKLVALRSASSNPLASFCPRVRINILIHGTMASVGTIFNPNKVLNNEDMAGSRSESYVRDNCRQQFRVHFNTSAVIQEGFYRISPRPLDQLEPENRCFGVFTIVQMLDFARQNAPKDPSAQPVLDLYYIFGWSGMLSQYERIKAAICFYNALSQELCDLDQALKICALDQLVGQVPELTTEIFAHSHGANVSLLLGLVDAKVRAEDLWDTYAFFSHHTIYARQAQLLDLILKKYCSQDSQEAKKCLRFNMEKWLYTPEANALERPLVSSLHMLGGPIQPENFPCGFSKTFGRVCNWFSPTDNIQKSDVFSVLSGKCARLVDPELVEQANAKFKPLSDPTQLRSSGFFQRELLFKNYPKKYGPSHLEMWMLNFTEREGCVLRPIPTGCLIPFFDADKSVASLSYASLLLTQSDGPEGLNCQVLLCDGSKGDLILIGQDKMDAMKTIAKSQEPFLDAVSVLGKKTPVTRFFATLRGKIIDKIATS